MTTLESLKNASAWLQQAKAAAKDEGRDLLAQRIHEEGVEVLRLIGRCVKQTEERAS